MSDTMLHGILNMPPELWLDDPVNQAARYSACQQASKRLEEDAKEIQYLEDSVYRLQKENDELRKQKPMPSDDELKAVISDYTSGTKGPPGLSYVDEYDAMEMLKEALHKFCGCE